jgi:hypothetical protein
MTIEEFAEEKLKRLTIKLEKIQKEWAKTYFDEKPDPPLVSFEDWDNYFSDEL